MMGDSAFIAVTLVFSALCGLPYVWFSYRKKITPDLPSYIAIVLSVGAIIGGTRSGWRMIEYSISDPEKLGIIQGNDVTLLGIGILCLLWISAQQTFKIYKSLVASNGPAS